MTETLPSDMDCKSNGGCGPRAGQRHPQCGRSLPRRVPRQPGKGSRFSPSGSSLGPGAAREVFSDCAARSPCCARSRSSRSAGEKSARFAHAAVRSSGCCLALANTAGSRFSTTTTAGSRRCRGSASRGRGLPHRQDRPSHVNRYVAISRLAAAARAPLHAGRAGVRPGSRAAPIAPCPLGSRANRACSADA